MKNILATILAAISLISCSKETKTDKNYEQDIIKYSAIKIKDTLPSREIQLPGEIESFYETDIFPRVSSYINKIHVDIGDRVEKGQVLAELEAPELKANLTAAYSKIKSAEAKYQTSKAHYSRTLKAQKTPGAISETDVETAWSKLVSDSIMVVAEQAHYESVKQLVDYLIIKAPFRGVITDRRLSPGSFVGPGGQNSVPLLKVKQLDRLRLRLAIPEAYIQDIRIGSPVHFTVRTFQNETFTGNVSRVSNSVQAHTRSEMIEIDINNHDRRLKPGMFVSAKLPVTANAGSIFIPKTAVLSNMERTFVIKVENGMAKWVDVQRGDMANNQVQVFGNLEVGDVILKVATDEIPDNSKIQIESAE